MAVNAIGQTTYGSGEIYFAKYLMNTTTPGAYRYLGNTPEFLLNSEIETLEHFDSDHGIRTQDDSITTSQTRGGNITTDNINQENLALFFTGTTGIITQASAASQVENIASVQFGTYHLGVNSTTRPTGYRNITVSAITGSGGTPTYVNNTDYVVDAISGTVRFLEGGTLTQGTAVVINYAVGASTRDQIISGSQTIEGALKFKSFNATGPKWDYFMPRVKLSPDGDFALKGEDWLEIPFNVQVLKLGELESVYIESRPVVS